MGKEMFRNIVKHENGRTTADLNINSAKIAETNVRKQEPNDIDEVKKLAKSINKHGLKQRILCDPEGEIFVGKRRYEAFKQLGLEWIPCEIEEVDSFKQRVASYVENRDRKNMSVTQEAMILKGMMEDKDLSIKRLAKELGEPLETVRKRIAILDKFGIPGPGTPEIVYGTGTKEDAKRVTMSKADMLSREWIPDEARTKLVERITSEGMTEKDLGKVLNTTRAFSKVLEGEPDEVKEKMNEKLSDKLYTEDLSLGDITSAYSEATNSPPKLTVQYFEEDMFADMEEARAYAAKYSGTVLGKVTLWKLEIDKRAESEGKEKEENTDE